MPNIGDLFIQGFIDAVHGFVGSIASNPGPWVPIALEYGGIVVLVVLAKWLFRHRSRRRAHRR